MKSAEWWAEISHELEAHVRDEERFLQSYRQLVDSIDDQRMRLLVELIVEDEERHHELMARIAREARDSTDDAPSAAPQFSADELARLLGPTEHFLSAEREDRQRLRALGRRLRPLRNDTMWPLVIELMEMDTRKHIRILQYLLGRMRAAR
jgi:rubrerythrin